MDLHIKKAICSGNNERRDNKYILKIQLFTFLKDLSCFEALRRGYWAPR